MNCFAAEQLVLGVFVYWHLIEIFYKFQSRRITLLLSTLIFVDYSIEHFFLGEVIEILLFKICRKQRIYISCHKSFMKLITDLLATFCAVYKLNKKNTLSKKALLMCMVLKNEREISQYFLTCSERRVFIWFDRSWTV